VRCSPRILGVWQDKRLTWGGWQGCCWGSLSVRRRREMRGEPGRLTSGMPGHVRRCEGRNTTGLSFHRSWRYCL